MWSLRERNNGSFYLVFDKDRRRTHNLRGVWEYLCSQDTEYTNGYIRVAKEAGYLTCGDNEGNVRILILE